MATIYNQSRAKWFILANMASIHDAIVHEQKRFENSGYSLSTG